MFDMMSQFLQMTWNFLCNCYVPGTQLSFGVLFFGLTVVPIAFRLLSILFNFNYGGSKDND